MTRAAPARRSTRPPLAPSGLILALAIAAAGLLLLPIIALAVGGGLAAIPDALASPAIRTALRLTAVTSLLATAIAIVLGIPLAIVAERRGGILARIAGAIGEIPLAIPPVVIGLGLLLAFGRDSLLGGALAAANLQLTFTSAAVVLAQASAALPLIVLATRAGLAAADTRPELAAAALGDTPLRRTVRVTLPSISGSIALGAALGWGRAAGEFGATLTFAGSLPGRTRTLPLAVFNELQHDTRLAAGAAMVQLGVAVVVVLAARALRDRA